MAETIAIDQVCNAILRVVVALRDNIDYLTELDQAVGDGDLGVAATKIADVMEKYVLETNGKDDLGKYILNAGMRVSSAAPSTMGTLIAYALMCAGREIMGKQELDADALAKMLISADQGIQDRGRAKLGDKTVIDALDPAAHKFEQSIQLGSGLSMAGRDMLCAAIEGLNSVTPLQSRIGRAGWVGERSQDKIDPGCALMVIVLKGIVS
jgi:dihydroxyacetone kinase